MSLQTVQNPPLPSFVTVPYALKEFLEGVGLRLSWQRYDENLLTRVSRMGMRPLNANDIKAEQPELYEQVFNLAAGSSLEIDHESAEKLSVDEHGYIRNEDVILCVASAESYRKMRERSEFFQAQRESRSAQQTEEIADQLARAFGPGREVATRVAVPSVRDQVEIEKDLANQARAMTRKDHK